MAHPSSSNGEPKTKFQKLWHLLENPKSSKLGWLIWAISTLWTIASIIVLFLSSLPNLHQVGEDGHTSPNPALHVLEMVLVIGFAVGFNVRLVLAPAKLAFFKAPLHNIEQFTFVPIILSWFFHQPHFMMVMAYAFRPLRLVRMIKDLNPRGLRLIVGSFANAQGFTVLAVYFIMKLHFGIAIYFNEIGEPHNPFQSLFSGLWFAVVTMSTVGFGDMVPETPMGKLTATLSITWAVIMLATFFAVVSNNYTRLSKLQRLADASETKNLKNGKGGDVEEGIELRQPAV